MIICLSFRLNWYSIFYIRETLYFLFYGHCVLFVVQPNYENVRKKCSKMASLSSKTSIRLTQHRIKKYANVFSMTNIMMWISQERVNLHLLKYSIITNQPFIPYEWNSTNLLICSETDLMKLWPTFSDGEFSGCFWSSQSCAFKWVHCVEKGILQSHMQSVSCIVFCSSSFRCFGGSS